MKRILLNPGPVNVTQSVIDAMNIQNCHREKEVTDIIQKIRSDIVSLSGSNNHTTTLFTSSGTGAIEAVMNSTMISKVPGNLNPDYALIISNGAYGIRMKQIANSYGIPCVLHSQKFGNSIDMETVKSELKTKIFSHVLVVHHETTTGVLNPIKEIGELAKEHDCTYIVDAISSFGGVPFKIKECNIDFLVSTSNKCIQSIPGISIVISNKQKIEQCKDISQSVYFNLYDEWKHQEETGMFRFTSPVQVIYALQQALNELRDETIEKRYHRYSKSYDALVKGFADLKFKLYPTEEPSKLLATFNEPQDFNFNLFHDKLYEKGYVIYPGKLADKKTFRIAVMGDISYNDIEQFLSDCKPILKEMKHGKS